MRNLYDYDRYEPLGEFMDTSKKKKKKVLTVAGCSLILPR